MKHKLGWILAVLAGFSPIAMGQTSPASGAQDAVGLVRAVKVLPDKAPDCSSLKSIVETVTRGCKNNDEKAVAVYNFMILSHYHLNYPSEPGGIPVLKEINSYGWSLCGGLHTVESGLWRELGWGWRYVGWSNPGHTTVEAQYDGRWHYLDAFLKFYAWMPDGKGGRTIAGEEDIAKDSQKLLNDAFVLDPGRKVVYAKENQFDMKGETANWQAPAFLSCGDPLSGIESGVKSRSQAGSPETWAGLNHATGTYSTDVNLAPGFCMENTWDTDAQTNAWFWATNKTYPHHTCPAHKDTRNDPAYGLVLEPYVNSKPARSYGVGTLTIAPDFSSDAALSACAVRNNVKYSNKAFVPAESGKPGSVVFNLTTPYVLVKAQGEAVGADTVEVSLDAGKTYKPVDIKDFTSAVKVDGAVSAFVRMTFKDALKSVKLVATFQNNPGSLPYLSPGKNKVTVSVADPKALGQNSLVVTYAYKVGSRAKSFEQLCDQGKEIAKQHNVKWSDSVTCVRKTFAAKDLPATFAIDCPTPKGEYPVYPRMLFLRREVVAPNAAPSSLPADVVEPKSATSEELKELPIPFTVGLAQQEAAKPRTVKTMQIPMTYLQFVSDKGEVSTGNGRVSWPKTPAEEGKVAASMVEVVGDLKAMPTKNFAAARLMVPVVCGHSSAAEKLGVVALSSAPEAGKACDVKTLTDTVGSTVVPKQPEDTPQYKPAKIFAIDVTRALKSVAAGEAKFNGFGLRIVPDRGTDEGYTVRCTISATDPMVLEVDSFAE